jgi:hypothetical protein
MSISNVDRMREALIRDEINYLATLSRDDLFRQCEGLVIEKYHNMDDRYIEIEYESLA